MVILNYNARSYVFLEYGVFLDILGIFRKRREVDSTNSDVCILAE